MNKYHIVYRTTCTITSHYYIGVHSTRDLDDGYIGSGVKFLNYVKRYGKENFYRTIISFHTTRDEAFTHEREMLTEEVLADKNCLNLVEGGRGYNHTYGQTFKDRISDTRKSRLTSSDIKPTKHTEEHKQHLRENNPGGRATAKPIYQIDTTGKVVRVWGAARQAGTMLGLKSWRNITALANNKRPQTAYGYYWRWVGDADVVGGVLQTIEGCEAIRKDISKRASKQTIQRNATSLEIINVWNSQSEAGRVLGLDHSAISLAVKNKKPYAGFLWERVSIAIH